MSGVWVGRATNGKRGIGEEGAERRSCTRHYPFFYLILLFSFTFFSFRPFGFGPSSSCSVDHYLLRHDY